MNRQQEQLNLDRLVKSSGKELLCATFAGVSHVALLYPFDTIKVSNNTLNLMDFVYIVSA